MVHLYFYFLQVLEILSQQQGILQKKGKLLQNLHVFS